jgi:ubiquinol-cytochrome c reductase iron-sulfur subunit
MTVSISDMPTLRPAPGTRRDFIHIAAGAMAVGGAAMAAWPLVDQLNPAADALAGGTTEFQVDKVALGQEVTISWRKQPIFVRHRTLAEIAAAVTGDGAHLRDPARDEERHKPGKPEWLIVIGVGAHLGWVPTFGEGEYKGWLCPCHGSVYDTSGRIRVGPAPKNLYLPPYEFLSPTKIKIG